MRKLLTLLLSLSLCLGVFAEDTIQSYPPQGILTFKGLDDTSSPLIIQDGRASALQNVVLSPALTLQKRHGYKIIGNKINHPIGTEYFPAVTGLYYTKLSSGTGYNYASAGERLYYLNSSTWTRIALSSDLTYSADNQLSWVTAIDTVIFTNGVDTVKKITSGTTPGTLDFSSLTSTYRPTTAKCIAWFKNYLVVGNVTENSTKYTTRIRWSNVGTIETWSDADYIDIAELGGQQIEAFGQLNDDLFIFLTDSIWKASLVGGTETYNLSKVIDGIGCISKNSIQTVNLYGQGKGLVFLSKDKRVYFFNGSSIMDLSQLIHGTMNGLGATRLTYAVSASTPTNYYLCVSDGTSTKNNLLLDFQLEIAEWTKHTNINANAMAYVVDSSSLPQVYFGNYDSFIYQLIDDSLDSDVVGKVEGVTSIQNNYKLSDNTATGIFVVFDTAINYDATGAIMEITSGTGLGEKKVIVYQTSTGVMVDSSFSTNPSSSSGLTIGDIDAYYKTKWFDLGSPTRIKLMGELYFWADALSNNSIDISYAVDFGSILDTKSITLSSSGGVWGTAIWGTSLWGGEEAMFKKAKMSGEGRYLRLTFQNDEIDESFNIYGYAINNWILDIQ